MNENIIVSDIKDNIAKITLNRPRKKNALSIALRDEVSQALEELAKNSEVKVVILTGSGGIFSAGFDLKEFEQAVTDEDFTKKLWDSSDRFHHTCLFFPLPLIAAVNGPAIAGGFDLATMCDIRLASQDAYFSHPEITFSQVLYSPLHEMVGGAIARELCLTGRKVDADEASSLRIVSKVVTADQLETEVNTMAATIARASRETLLQMKAKIIERARLKGEGTLDL
jgi:enoyl-CoA hydratase/carnithine racemase